ncbi:unnamed protein product [Rhodiola kirilowii]
MLMSPARMSAVPFVFRISNLERLQDVCHNAITHFTSLVLISGSYGMDHALCAGEICNLLVNEFVS